MTVATTQIGCIKAATEILGDKWTPQLLRFFINEETVRFCQIQDLVGGINPRTLSARLTQLEDHDIITKASHRAVAASTSSQKKVETFCQYFTQWKSGAISTHNYKSKPIFS